MAIKGKKKPKGRGPAARRRPAAPPRPRATSPGKRPWYRTSGGLAAIVLVGLALLATAAWAVNGARSRAAQADQRRTELRDFTREVSGILADVQLPMREMAGAPFNTANPETIAALPESSQRWATSFEQAGALAQAIVAPPGGTHALQNLQQGLGLYASAAKTYALVPGETRENRQQRLIERATEQRDQASRVLTTALSVLDAERLDAGLDASGIPAPAGLTPILPTPEPAGDDGAQDDG